MSCSHSLTENPRNLLGNLKTLLLGAFLVATVPQSPAQAQCPPVKVFCLGDSITYGTGAGNGGYRGPLYYALRGNGYSVDFVGSLTTYPDLVFPPDLDHEGHPGWRADQIRDNIYASGANWLGNHPADVILFHIGTNDIHAGESAAAIATEIDQTLDRIDLFEADSGRDVMVFLARIINRTDLSSAEARETTRLNQEIQALADARAAAGDRIRVVDMEGVLDYSTDMADTLHPNELGYARMSGEPPLHSSGGWYPALVDYLQACSTPPCDLLPRFDISTLQEGAEYYTDRDYTLLDVPTAYAGLEMIKAPNDDRLLTHVSGYLTFVMPESGTVYVGYDRRASSPPDWLSGFTFTGDTIATSLSSQGTLEVYARAFAAGDCVNLGCNFAPGSSSENRSNFLVFHEAGGVPPPPPPPPSGDCSLDSRFDITTLQEGMYYYTDRTYTLTSVPSQYLGLETIRLPNDDRLNTSATDYLTFTVPADVTVFVGFDSRASDIPDWLSGFASTGDSLGTSLSSQGALRIYARAYDSGDCVDFGGNYAPGSSSENRSNYLVFYGVAGEPPPPPPPPPPSGDCALDSRFDITTLQEGMYYYTDRTYTLTSVPSQYLGLETIRLPNDDRLNTSATDYLTFTVPADVTVFVGFDSRASSIPDWLSGFASTGDSIGTSLSSQGSLRIYARAYGSGDCVDFGGNYAPGSSSENRSNYLVFYGVAGEPPPPPPPPSGDCALDSRFDITTLQEGMYYYTDRTYIITSVPSQYAGMDTILLPNDDRMNSAASDYLTFSAPADITVYVGFDSRASSVPDWMAGFSFTGDGLGTSLYAQGSLRIYARSYSAGECVNLGGNYGPGSSSENRSNYMVFWD